MANQQQPNQERERQAQPGRPDQANPMPDQERPEHDQERGDKNRDGDKKIPHEATIDMSRSAATQGAAR